MGAIDMLKGTASRAKMFGVDHAPEIAFGIATIELIATIVSAGKAAIKFKDKLEAHNERIAKLDRIKLSVEEGRANEEEEDVDIVASRKSCYMRLASDFFKCYWKTMILGVGTVATYAAGFGILSKRIGILSGFAAKVLDEKNKLEDGIINEYGEEKLIELKGGKEGAVLNSHVDESTGEVVVDKVEYPNMDKFVFCKLFDESHKDWQKTPGLNYRYVKQCLNMAQRALDIRGHLFYNEFLDIMGYDESAFTQEGQIFGWVKYKTAEEAAFHHSPGVILSNIDDDTPLAHAFKIGSEPSFLLRFNVDKEPIIGRVNYGREKALGNI